MTSNKTISAKTWPPQSATLNFHPVAQTGSTTTHFPFQWGEEAKLAWAHSRLATCSRSLAVDCTTYTLCLKKRRHLYFCNNCRKFRPILIILSLLNFKYTAEEIGIKTTTSSQVCCRTTLQNLNAQLTMFHYISKNSPLSVKGTFRWMMINKRMDSLLWTSFFTYLLFLLITDVIVIFCLLPVVVPFSYENASADQWHVRLKACVHSGGGHFEHIL